MKIRTSNGLRSVSAIAIRTPSGLRTVKSMMVRTPNGLRAIYGASSTAATALTPDQVTGYGYGRGAITVTTDQATIVVPSGGTIVWNFAGTGWQAISPSSGTSAFRKNVAPGATETTTVTATVNGVTSNQIIATVTNEYSGPM